MMMVSNFMSFTLFYGLITGCIVYPPTEFVSAGLTVQCIFGKFLGNENTDFIEYHIRRTAVTLLTHSLLPFGYLLGLQCFAHVDMILLASKQTFWMLFGIVSHLLPVLAVLQILKWAKNGWSNHPLAKDIKTLYNQSIENDQEYDWEHAATRINLEYRNVDKVTIISNSINRIIVIDNWIMKVTPYRVYVAHQDKSVLIVNKTDTHQMSRDEVQYINIEVKGTVSDKNNFNIRLNSLDFQDLQNKAKKPIVVLNSVVFHRTLLDRFVDTFKEQVAQNEVYETAQELEICIGCMQCESNIKLNQQCDGNMLVNGRSDSCVRCNCRPLWCIDCMAKWFASRQDKNAPETWLSSKCPCPVCRATFCMLDVCLVRKTSINEL